MLYRSLNWVLILAKHLKRIKHQLQIVSLHRGKHPHDPTAPHIASPRFPLEVFPPWFRTFLAWFPRVANLAVPTIKWSMDYGAFTLYTLPVHDAMLPPWPLTHSPLCTDASAGVTGAPSPAIHPIQPLNLHLFSSVSMVPVVPGVKGSAISALGSMSY